MLAFHLAHCALRCQTIVHIIVNLLLTCIINLTNLI